MVDQQETVVKEANLVPTMVRKIAAGNDLNDGKRGTATAFYPCQ